MVDQTNAAGGQTTEQQKPMSQGGIGSGLGLGTAAQTPPSPGPTAPPPKQPAPAPQPATPPPAAQTPPKAAVQPQPIQLVFNIDPNTDPEKLKAAVKAVKEALG